MTSRRIGVHLTGVGLAALSAGLTLLLGEVALRLALPAATSYRALRPGLEARFHPDPALLPGVLGPSRFHVNSVGLRGREGGAERTREFRVLCLGGSTTESLVIDQERTWTARLEQLLGRTPDGRMPWVGNAGRSGLSSEHHVLQMEHLPPVYDPDLVLVLVGVNDFAGLLRDGGTYDPTRAETKGGRRRLIDRAFAMRPGSYGPVWPDDPWWKRTRIWTLLRAGREQLEGIGESQDGRGLTTARWRAMRAGGRMTAELPPLGVGLQRYRRNLLEMVRLARKYKVEIALITQPTLWRADLDDEEKALLWMGGVGDFRRIPGSLYYDVAALERGMNAYNRVLREVCAEERVLCVDLAERLPKTTEFFFDDCHFTNSGQEQVARILAPAIQEWLGRRLSPNLVAVPR